MKDDLRYIGLAVLLIVTAILTLIDDYEIKQLEKRVTALEAKTNPTCDWVAEMLRKNGEQDGGN